ncbi:nucleotidyl transferase AbiEii/AbiGii toxin family protein [Thalassospira sp.]|uniref:nucleotidyl transferase AbiEii/AbiGii toxin family protein n=1 Tax=Thalassospira sp. TaxID=1912094 RepID=UPI001B2160A3|nr:nucleotidyl transferase AbiEii/AbiGii toxin family protein [Thalassospira sp.]MBO6522115.1 nucleotidyl transferase AbiEii/AbiGii toxin family protein [Rhodospirillales bacterium]MBO6773771.1 nucleotidyl transferase AbiEii/AbiGii toxin family protein [Thalassospira sp.]
MADTYHSLKPQEQKEILQTAAARLGRQAAVLEKDIWVCWALQTLFSIPDAHPMAFKGGTSLSKVYEIIDRFSEDVDITLDYRAFDDDFDPFAPGVSKSKIRQFSDRLKGYVQSYANDVVVPGLQAAITGSLVPVEHDIRVDESGEKIWFSYPSVIEAQDEYLKSEVLIELGGRNVIDPNERHEIEPYVAPLAEGLEFPEATVTVLSPSRTFWEKATLIHVECNRGRLKESPERLSRHWYDLTQLAKHPTGQSAINDRDLFEDVVRHKEVFFNASYAKYDDCLHGRLLLLPDDDSLPGLKADYGKMTSAGMMYREAPDFDDIVEKIRAIETKVNDWR